MTTSEFSDSFDTLLNSYGSSFPYGRQSSDREVYLDEYEKSLFLTAAQEELVISLYTGKNSYHDFFEGTEELRRYLSNLVVEAELLPTENSSGTPLGVDSSSRFFTLPIDLWYLTYESVAVSDAACEGMSRLDVFPVRQDEYPKIRKNPFRGANNRRALRLDLSDGVIEIVCKHTVSSYYVRYLRKPKPIILEDLADTVTIDGIRDETPCELHEALHQKILELAVIKALESKGIKVKNT